MGKSHLETSRDVFMPHQPWDVPPAVAGGLAAGGGVPGARQSGVQERALCGGPAARDPLMCLTGWVSEGKAGMCPHPSLFLDFGSKNPFLNVAFLGFSVFFELFFELAVW